MIVKRLPRRSIDCCSSEALTVLPVPPLVMQTRPGGQQWALRSVSSRYDEYPVYNSVSWELSVGAGAVGCPRVRANASKR